MTLRAILLAVLLVACQSGPKPNPNYPQPENNKPDDCVAACKKGEEMKCLAAQPSPNGVPCVEVCRKNIPPATTGIRPQCQAVAANCVVYDECTY